MIAFARNGTSDGAETAACRCRELPPGSERSDAAAEMKELARELATAFGETLKSYREHANLTAEEAANRIAKDAPEDIDRILNAPPNAVSWLDLDALAWKDENLALERWQQIKEAARNEFRSGHRAARAVEDGGGPWERARFAAVRAELMESWKPHNAMEQLLVDPTVRPDRRRERAR